MTFSEPLKYSWRWNNDEIPEVARLEDLGRVLVLPEVQIKHQGDYECTVEGSEGQNMSRSTNLIITGKAHKV